MHTHRADTDEEEDGTLRGVSELGMNFLAQGDVLFELIMTLKIDMGAI